MQVSNLTKGGVKVRSRSLQADILNYISDNKLHTYQSIADAVECSFSSARRHIQDLSYRFNIEIRTGGFGKGGIRLIPDENVKTNYLNENELQLIVSKLESLQDSSPNIKKFVNSIAPLIEKRRENILWDQKRN